MAKQANTSILPEDYFAKRVARRTNVVCLSLFFVVMTGVVATFFVTGRQWDDIEHRAEQVNAQYAAADQQIAQRTEYNKQRDTMQRKARITAALHEPVPKTRILSDLINDAPAQLSWKTFELTTEVSRQAAAPRTGIERLQQKSNAANQKKKVEQDPLAILIPKTRINVKLVGIAPKDTDVSDYMRALHDNPLFQAVTLNYTEAEKIDDLEMRMFEFVMKVNQEIDLSTVQPVRVEGLEQNPMSDEIQMKDGKVGGVFGALGKMMTLQGAENNGESKE